ncbi:DeoR/GlpR family DNA-binding transcription regulator [Zavarzinia sp.]|uniref:DeoR/GlpR family DNA-binding transcription regulator n=1 Tax=Zavarzinia sp. TaxID=2027920 RepID=UPI00356978B2
MNFSPRQQHIVDLVRRHGFMSVDGLAGHLAVTPQTIRRDLAGLRDAQVLRRCHGGAEYLEAGERNLSYDDRKITHREAKRAIGAHVARAIPDGASVSFGIGTTPEFVARALAGHAGLTVVTCNFNVAMALSGQRDNRIIVPGGRLRLPDRDILGAEVEEMFRAYRVDYGIFGVGGIEPDGTLLDFDRAEVGARLALAASCRNSILVADVTKCGRPAPARGGFLGDAGSIVLDRAPPPAFAPLFPEDRLSIAEPMP